METAEENADGRPSLLVIDDNADIRTLVSELLGGEYEIHQARDGREGLAKAMRLIPDLIICDIMMPVMDGLECCRRIKAEISTSHIPVLMLTACAMDRQRVEGYDSGADGYVSKPFSTEVLQARCRNLIANRKRIRDLWQGGGHPLPAPVRADAPAVKVAGQPGNVDLDNEFYNRFLAIFSEEISNPGLSIDQIASKMGLGHSQFYRKIMTLSAYRGPTCC